MNEMSLRDYYEQDADRFWNPNKGLVGRDLDVYPFMQGLFGSILEYGCGSGSLLLSLAKEDRFSHVIGVDISNKALSKIKEAYRGDNNLINKVQLLLTEGDSIPSIQNESMDVVISVATIEHVINPYIILDELYRIAKPDATLICSVPNYAYIKHVIYLLLGKQPRTGTDEPVENWRQEGWDGMHLHTFTKSSFTALLKDCGWEPEVWRGAGEKYNRLGFGYLRQKFPGIFSGELIVKCRKVNN